MKTRNVFKCEKLYSLSSIVDMCCCCWWCCYVSDIISKHMLNQIQTAHKSSMYTYKQTKIQIAFIDSLETRCEIIEQSLLKIVTSKTKSTVTKFYCTFKSIDIKFIFKFIRQATWDTFRRHNRIIIFNIERDVIKISASDNHSSF